MTASAQIYRIGLHCALGKGYRAAAEAYFARDYNFVKSEMGPLGADGMRMTLACAIPFHELFDFELRLQKLFAEAVEDLAPGEADVAMPLRLVVPRWLKGHAMGERLRAWIGETYARLFREVETVADGDTLALYELVRGLQETAREHRFTVGALDSYMDAGLLDLLALNDRILKRGTPHGLVPGEACVLVMLGTDREAGAHPPLGSLRAVFNNFEPESLSAPQGIIGRGLAMSLRQALDSFVPDRLLIDLNGERWRSEDIGFALSGARIPDALLSDFETPLGNTGDCGAANGLILVALALAQGFEAGQSEEDTMSGNTLSIVSTSHFEGPRCVAVVEKYGAEA